MGCALPPSLIGTLELNCPALCKRYPGLELPRRFDGNYSTGIFIPAARVAEAHAFVQAALTRMVGNDEKPFRQLLRVLRVAAARGLGYWEATECTVVADPPYADWLATPIPNDIAVYDAPFKEPSFTPLCIEDDRMIILDANQVVALDTRTVPPIVEFVDDKCEAACFSPWGTDLIVNEDDRHPGTYYVFETFRESGKAAILDVTFRVRALHRIGSHIFAMPHNTNEEVPTSSQRACSVGNARLRRSLDCRSTPAMAPMQRSPLTTTRSC